MTVRALKGMAVVSLAEGEKMGTVEDVLIDSTGRQATAFLLTGPSGTGLLPLSSVKSVGKDAVTIPQGSDIQWGSRPEGGRPAEQVFDLKVVDAAGTMGGTVHDITFDLLTGAIQSFEIRTGGVFGIGAQEHVVPVGAVHGMGESLLTVESLTGPSPDSSDQTSAH